MNSPPLDHNTAAPATATAAARIPGSTSFTAGYVRVVQLVHKRQNPARNRVHNSRRPSAAPRQAFCTKLTEGAARTHFRNCVHTRAPSGHLAEGGEAAVGRDE